MRPCPACAAADARYAFTVAGYAHLRCHRCGSLFVAEPPEAADLAATYLAPDYHHSAVGEEARMRREAAARAVILAGRGVRSLLEVGCGPGHFLDACRDRGIVAEAVDRAPTAAAARARGHRIHPQWFEELAPVTPRFDAIAFWEVLEHLPSPRETLARARRWLAPGGILALSTPSASGLPARLLGRRFPMICPPDHLSIFSRRGLAALVGAAGFVPVRWDSFSGLGRRELRRGFQRFFLGESSAARGIAGGLATVALPLAGLVDRAGFGSSFEVYAVAESG